MEPNTRQVRRKDGMPAGMITELVATRPTFFLAHTHTPAFQERTIQVTVIHEPSQAHVLGEHHHQGQMTGLRY
jgi:hypothetical protein